MCWPPWGSKADDLAMRRPFDGREELTVNFAEYLNISMFFNVLSSISGDNIRYFRKYLRKFLIFNLFFKRLEELLNLVSNVSDEQKTNCIFYLKNRALRLSIQVPQ